MHDLGLTLLPGRGSPQPPETAPLQRVWGMLPGPGHHFLPFRPSRFGLDLGGGVLGPLGTQAGSGVHTLVLCIFKPSLRPRHLLWQTDICKVKARSLCYTPFPARVLRHTHTRTHNHTQTYT